jgi:hypothetical protein
MAERILPVSGMKVFKVPSPSFLFYRSGIPMFLSMKHGFEILSEQSV